MPGKAGRPSSSFRWDAPEDGGKTHADHASKNNRPKLPVRLEAPMTQIERDGKYVRGL